MTNPACTALISLHCSEVRRGQSIALRDVDWSLHSGQHWAILGANGAGKSTFMRLARGEVHPVQGRGACHWHFDGLPADPAEARQASALISPDDHDLYKRGRRALTGIQTVITGMRGTIDLYDDPTAREVHAAKVLLEAQDAAHLCDMPITLMSRGQARLVLLVRALAARPRILFLDEALDGLDRSATSRIIDALQHAADTGTSIIFCTHRGGEIPPFTTHVALIQDGVMTMQGLVTDTLPRIRKQVADTVETTHTDLPPLPQTATPPPSPAFLVRMCDAAVLRSGRYLLKNINWTMRAGERWGLIGANGAGKSTFIKLVTAECRSVASGTVEWYGKKGPQDIQSIRRRIGMVSPELQATYAYDVTSLELVLSGFFSSISLWETPSEAQTERARALMNFVGMKGIENRRIRSLSYGQLRRLLIARALAPAPDILLLDEPCAGLDAPSRRLFLRTVERLCENGASLVYVAHAPLELPEGLTHLIHLADGRISEAPAVNGTEDIRRRLA